MNGIHNHQYRHGATTGIQQAASCKSRYLATSSSREDEGSTTEHQSEELNWRRMTHDSATFAAKKGEVSSEAANAAKHGQMHTLRFPILTQEFPDTIFSLSNQSQLFEKAVTPPCKTSAGGMWHHSRGDDIQDTLSEQKFSLSKKQYPVLTRP